MALARLKGKIPKEIPFELKRCESCRRAKQGAIVCRGVEGRRRQVDDPDADEEAQTPAAATETQRRARTGAPLERHGAPRGRASEGRGLREDPGRRDRADDQNQAAAAEEAQERAQGASAST